MPEPDRKETISNGSEREESSRENDVVSGEYSLTEEDLTMGDDYISSALAALEGDDGITEDVEDNHLVAELTNGNAAAVTEKVDIGSGESARIKQRVKQLEEMLRSVRDKANQQLEEQSKDLRGARRVIQQLRDEVEVMKKSLAEKEKESEENKRKWQETAASYINYQKQMKKKLNEYVDLEKADIIRLFLPVADNIGRPLEYNTPSESLFDGIRLIFKQFEDLFNSIGVKPIAALGEKFDPYFHDAIDRIPRDDVAPNVVVEEIQRGYMMGEKVLRPAKVAVSFSMREPSRATDSDPDNNEPDEPDVTIKDGNSVINPLDLSGKGSSPEEDEGGTRTEADETL